MKNKKLLLASFVTIVVVQLAIPAKMVYDHEEILISGKPYKFKMAPVDPIDPFRGKYLTLNFTNNNIDVENAKDWRYSEEMYALLAIGNDGYTKVINVSKAKPANNMLFVKAAIGFNRFNFLNRKDSNELFIDYPFNKYYIEESKAKEAEQAYRAAVRDTNKVNYAIVCIHEGEAVLKDLIINGTSINDKPDIK